MKTVVQGNQIQMDTQRIHLVERENQEFTYYPLRQGLNSLTSSEPKNAIAQKASTEKKIHTTGFCQLTQSRQIMNKNSSSKAVKSKWVRVKILKRERKSREITYYPIRHGLNGFTNSEPENAIAHKASTDTDQ